MVNFVYQTYKFDETYELIVSILFMCSVREHFDYSNSLKYFGMQWKRMIILLNVFTQKNAFTM